jgi:transposase InsO family protein
MVSFVDEHRDLCPVAVMCRTIGLPERTFHAAKARPRSARSISDELHAIEIRRVWTANYSCYGSRRVYKKLRKEGYVVARCTVGRVMGDIGLRGVQRGRRQFTTIPNESAPRPADLVERQFVAERPNQLWLADITYVSTWQGWLYVLVTWNHATGCSGPRASRELRGRVRRVDGIGGEVGCSRPSRAGDRVVADLVRSWAGAEDDRRVRARAC